MARTKKSGTPSTADAKSKQDVRADIVLSNNFPQFVITITYYFFFSTSWAFRKRAQSRLTLYCPNHKTIRGHVMHCYKKLKIVHDYRYTPKQGSLVYSTNSTVHCRPFSAAYAWLVLDVARSIFGCKCLTAVMSPSHRHKSYQ